MFPLKNRHENAFLGHHVRRARVVFLYFSTEMNFAPENLDKLLVEVTMAALEGQEKLFGYGLFFFDHKTKFQNFSQI